MRVTSILAVESIWDASMRARSGSAPRSCSTVQLPGILARTKVADPRGYQISMNSKLNVFCRSGADCTISLERAGRYTTKLRLWEGISANSGFIFRNMQDAN
jgi:hypothetical protein